MSLDEPPNSVVPVPKSLDELYAFVSKYHSNQKTPRKLIGKFLEKMGIPRCAAEA